MLARLPPSLTGFVCSRSVARSVHLLCNVIVNCSWLPHDHIGKHIRERLQV